MREVVRWRNVTSRDPPCGRKSSGGCEHEAVASGRKRAKGWGTGPRDFPLTTMSQPGLQKSTRQATSMATLQGAAMPARKKDADLHGLVHKFHDA